MEKSLFLVKYVKKKKNRCMRDTAAFSMEVRFDRSHEFNPEHHKLMVSFTTDKYIAKGSELDNRIDKTVMQALQ
mgnify:CR=1 FL=1